MEINLRLDKLPKQEKKDLCCKQSRDPARNVGQRRPAFLSKDVHQAVSQITTNKIQPRNSMKKQEPCL